MCDAEHTPTVKATPLKRSFCALIISPLLKSGSGHTHGSLETVSTDKMTIMYLRKFSLNIMQRFVPAQGTRLGSSLCTMPLREVTSARVVDLRTDSRDQVSTEMLRYMMEEKVTMKGM